MMTSIITLYKFINKRLWKLN